MASHLEYRGYDLETKHLLVGWQITVHKEGTFVTNGAVLQDEDFAMLEARVFIDGLIKKTLAINAAP